MNEFGHTIFAIILILICIVVLIWGIYSDIKNVKDEKEEKEQLLDQYKKQINNPYLQEQLDLFIQFNPKFTAQELKNAYRSIFSDMVRNQEFKKKQDESERQLFFELRIRSVKRRQNYQSRKRRISYGINRNYQRHI